MDKNSLWEYKVVGIGGMLGAKGEQIEARMNEMGLEGWDAFAVCLPHNGGKLLVFAKRPLSPTARRRREPLAPQ